MTRPPGPFERDSTDGPLRPLLWRLRARLVKPPAELRGRDDLDRIFATAREQAHTTPSPGATAHPGTSMDASAPTFPLYAPLHEQTGDELARRRRRALPQLGRIAAAVIVVVATASGMAGARDGAVTLNALLGREPRVPQQSASGELPEVDAIDAEDFGSDGDTDSSAGGDDAEAPAHAGVPDDSDSGEVADELDAAEPLPEADVDADQPSPSEEARDDAEQDADTGQGGGAASGSEPSTEPPNGSSSPKESSESPDTDQPASTPEPKPEPEPEQEADEKSEAPSDGAPSGEAEVIAAPPPDDLDGFGGPVPRDCDSLTDCLPAGDDEAGDDVADDDDTPADDAPSDEGSTDGDETAGDGTPDDAADDDASDGDTADGDDGDDLARRRFQPSNEPRSS